MSILVNQEGRAVAIAYTAPYKKTAELVKHLDLIYERLEVVADDISSMIEGHVWR